MELNIKLYEQDYLTYQLFAASQSPRIRKKRLIEWLLTTSIFVLAGVVFLITGTILLFYYFMGVSFLTLAFYPLYVRRKYKKHYLRHIRETFRKNFGKNVKIIFGSSAVETSDSDSHSEIKYTLVTSVSELPLHFFVHLNSGASLILPKKSVADVLALKNRLVLLAQTCGVTYNTFLNWKWK